MKVLESAHGIIWGPWIVGAFLMVRLILSVRCHFFHIMGFKHWWKATAWSLVSGEKDAIKGEKGLHYGIPQFQSVCTALVATVGTGNIAGVTATLVSGGPGAVFWMWVSALIGMATAYGETYLCCKYRFKDEQGKWVCGPFIYMKKGLGIPFMAAGYSFFCALGMGSMVQANSAAETLEFIWGIPSGMGSGTLAVLHGPAEHISPQEQGMWAMFEVFFDTVVLCSLTALVILCTTQGDTETLSLTGVALATACFSAKLGMLGEWFISISMVVFAFATLIAWYYLGQQAVTYLKRKIRIIHRLYPILFLAAVFAGGCIWLEAVWLLSNLWNGLMAFFNLTALLFLAGEIRLPDTSSKLEK